MGVIFFIYNAAFSTILLIIVLVASIIAVTAKNPDTRYQPMRDDRGSFIKSQTQLTTELDALGATARGEGKHGYNGKQGSRIEDDEEDSWSGGSSHQQQQQQQHAAYGGAPAYPADNASSRHMPPSYSSRQGAPSPYDQQSRTGSMTSGGQQQHFRQQNASPSPWQRGAGYD
jgi:hypothetical protein